MARANSRSRPRQSGRGQGDETNDKTISRYMEGDRLVSPLIDWKNVVPEQVELPDIAVLSRIDEKSLRAILQKFNILDIWPQLRADTSDYVKRLLSIPFRSEAYNAEIKRLTTAEGKTGLTKLLRRVYREYSVVYSMDGDPDTVFVRVPEGDENTCDPCLRLGGEEGTMEYHRSIGAPGSASCEGGDLCRCILMAVK
jgi:hypothetical protein